MKYALAAVIAASSLSSFAAQAGEPFLLSDASLDSVTAAGEVNFNTIVTKNVDINKTVNLNVNKNVTSTVELDGVLATAEASADAIGFEFLLAETDTFAQVSALGAFSFSESLAAGDNPLIITTP